MKNKAYDLSTYAYSNGEPLLFDANVWLFLFPAPNYDLKPDSVSPEVTDTVSVIAEIVGKSIRTLSRMLSLINLPDYIRAAIVPPLSGLNRTEGTLPVSQGYLFAANLDCPDLRNSL